jgi:protein-tyrosine-phosphatase
VTFPAIRVATICTGNICRSPMAEVALRHLVAEDPELDGKVIVTSAGTARWHVGQPMDPRARAALDRANLLSAGTLGAFADASYLNEQDLVLVMTREHRYEVRQRLSNDATDVVLWRDLLEPGSELDVADPYYGDDAEFDECLAILRAGGPRLKEVLRRRLGENSREA